MQSSFILKKADADNHLGKENSGEASVEGKEGHTGSVEEMWESLEEKHGDDAGQDGGIVQGGGDDFDGFRRLQTSSEVRQADRVQLALGRHQGCEAGGSFPNDSEERETREDGSKGQGRDSEAHSGPSEGELMDSSSTRGKALAVKGRMVGKLLSRLQRAKAGGGGSTSGPEGGEGIAEEVVSLPMPQGRVTVELSVTGSYVAFVTGRSCASLAARQEDTERAGDTSDTAGHAESEGNGDCVQEGGRLRGWKGFRYDRVFKDVLMHEEVDWRDAAADAAKSRRQVILGDGSLVMELLRDEGGSGWFLTALRVWVPTCTSEVRARSAALPSCPLLLTTQEFRHESSTGQNVDDQALERVLDRTADLDRVMATSDRLLGRFKGQSRAVKVWMSQAAGGGGAETLLHATVVPPVNDGFPRHCAWTRSMSVPLISGASLHSGGVVRERALEAPQ